MARILITADRKQSAVNYVKSRLSRYIEIYSFDEAISDALTDLRARAVNREIGFGRQEWIRMLSGAQWNRLQADVTAEIKQLQESANIWPVQPRR